MGNSESAGPTDPAASASDVSRASASISGRASAGHGQTGSPSPRLAPFPIWIATAGGVGYAPLAPGTFGSLVGFALFFLLARQGLPFYALTTLTLTVLGVWASERAEQHFGRSDDGRIVIDEVAGQLISLSPLVVLTNLPLGSWTLGASASVIDPSPRNLEIGVFVALAVTGFVLFRVFDIWKPGPVRWGEQRFKGGLGVMADDVIAGGLAAVVLVLPAYGVLVAHLLDLVRRGVLT